MEKRTLDMKKLVEAADLPVEGITLEGGKVYYDGVPFNQASDAEQLRVSCAIAMRENAKLRVIRVATALSWMMTRSKPSPRWPRPKTSKSGLSESIRAAR